MSQLRLGSSDPHAPDTAFAAWEARALYSAWQSPGGDSLNCWLNNERRCGVA